MALIDRVKARVPTQDLIELTNKDDTNATSIDDTVLQLAVDDAEGAFETLCGKAYDDTDKRHVAHIWQGVQFFLMIYAGETTTESSKYQEWSRKIKEELRLVTGNNRMKPKTSSKLTPADEAPGGIQVRPYFDTEDGFTDYVPESPGGDRRNRFFDS